MLGDNGIYNTAMLHQQFHIIYYVMLQCRTTCHVMGEGGFMHVMQCLQVLKVN